MGCTGVLETESPGDSLWPQSSAFQPKPSHLVYQIYSNPNPQKSDKLLQTHERADKAGCLRQIFSPSCIHCSPMAIAVGSPWLLLTEQSPC